MLEMHSVDACRPFFSRSTKEDSLHATARARSRRCRGGGAEAVEAKRLQVTPRLLKAYWTCLKCTQSTPADPSFRAALKRIHYMQRLERALGAVLPNLKIRVGGAGPKPAVK